LAKLYLIELLAGKFSAKGFSPWEGQMVLLHSLNGNELYLNNDLIEKIEAIPDTIITLTDGKTIRVKESPQEIVERIVHFKRRVCMEIYRNEN
jgi:flagellar protein FlbD